MATHGMYRRRDTRREQLVAEITDDLRRYSADAQHIGHAFANLHGLNPTDLQRPDRRDGRRAGSATRSPPAGSASSSTSPPARSPR